MNKTINELVALTELANDDELIVYDVSEGTSKKIKKSDFVTTSIASGNLKPPTSDTIAQSIVKLGSYDSQPTLQDALTTIFNSLTVGMPITLSFSYYGSFVGTAFKYGSGQYYGMMIVTRNDGVQYIYTNSAGTTTLSGGLEKGSVQSANQEFTAEWIKINKTVQLTVTTTGGSLVSAGNYTISGIPKVDVSSGTRAGGVLVTWGAFIAGYMIVLPNTNEILLVITANIQTSCESHLTYICQ